MCKILFVTGCFLSLVVAEIHVEPLNHSVAFSKERDIILSSDTWRVALDLHMNSYEEAISAIRADEQTIEEHRKEFAPVTELKDIQTLLDTLELKLHYFQQILPRRDRRRGLINLGGEVLKSIFGVATNSDIHLLHHTLNELQSSTFDIANSVSNQVMYVKKLDTATKVNANAVANLSSIVKDIVIESYERFQETTRDILWLNYTINGQSEFNTAVRQLEFAFLLMLQQINELLEAIQSVLQGKLPITLINPSALQNILRNVTLHLPEGYQ